MKQLLFNSVCHFFLISFVSAQVNNYRVNGEIKDGIRDGTAYVRYILKDRMVRDSAIIKDGRFSISGTLPGAPIMGKIMLREAGQKNAGDKNSSEVFLEPAVIKLEAFHDLERPSFSGSGYQLEFTELYNSLHQVRDDLRKIDNEYGKAQDEKDRERLEVLDQKLSDTYKKRQSVIGNFLFKHPVSLISAYKFDEFLGDGEIDIAVAEPAYNNLSPALKKLPVLQAGLNRITIAKKTQRGNDELDFALPDTAGNNIRVSSFKGKYLLIDFWASWCVPCRAENPALIEMYRKYKNSGFEILGVSLDARKVPWANAIIQDGMLWPQVSDLKIFDNEAAKLYDITSIPQNVLIDKGGKIIAKNLRGLALEKALTKIFN